MTRKFLVSSYKFPPFSNVYKAENNFPLPDPVRFVPKIEANELKTRQLEMNCYVTSPRSVNT